MLLRRCTQGIGLMSILLLSLALILNDSAILLAAAVPALGILGQYHIFNQRMRDLIGSVEPERSLSRNSVRKGTAVRVTTTITCRIPPGMQAVISDIPPVQTTSAGDIPAITAEFDPGLQTHTISYMIVPVIHGDHCFSGISVRVRNRFFEEEMTLTRKCDQEPRLAVQPSGSFAPPNSGLGDSSLDTRRTSIWTGADIHSLRDYTPGDDLRNVDWKVSAKYQKLVIRKYTAPMNYPPLIIVDLPWIGAPYPKKAFNLMISDVAGMVRNTSQTFQQVSVLIISGPNIVHMIREEKNLSQCLLELREIMHPADRSVHFYHTPDRSDLRTCVRDIGHAQDEGVSEKTAVYYKNLGAQYQNVLQHMRNPAFTGQVIRAISQIALSEAYLFTLESGDTSHIRHIVRPLRSRNIKVNVRVIASPEPEDDTQGGISQIAVLGGIS